MTVLQDGAGTVEGEVIEKDGRTMNGGMPLCVLHYDEKKRRYRVRLPDGTEVQKYVLDSSSNPLITVN